MADFNNLREQAKQWLSSMFVPKELSPEGIANTGAGATGMALGAVTQPGVVPAMYMLDKLLKTNAGKQIQTMLDATGPMGGGLDDIVVAGAKTAPAALGMVAPLVGNLGRMKPRGVPAKPSEYFHSNLAEAVDKAWLAEGKPSDLLNIKQVKAWLNKLPGMGVKKEEIQHFNLGTQLDSAKGLHKDNPDKITKQDLADLVDHKMPVLQINDGHSNPNIYSQYVVPGGTNYKNHVMSAEGSYDIDRPSSVDYLSNPMHDFNESADIHWISPDVLQHIRTTDRTLPNNQRALYAEEVQSDWQQEHPESYPLAQNYEELAQKYLYRYGADNGYDAVAWTPGSPHIERWMGEKNPNKHPLNNEILNAAYNNGDDPALTKKILKHPEGAKFLADIKDLNEKMMNTTDYGSPEANMLQDLRDSLMEDAKEKGIVPTLDRRFTGFETFYNKRMVDAATSMLKRMGGGEVSNTNLQSIIPPKPNPNPSGWGDPNIPIHSPNMEWKDIPQEPIETILNRYKYDNNPENGYVQPNPVKSFVYDIKPEDKAKPGAQGWEAPMAGKTVPLWMLLSGMAFDQLRGDKK
jgi:hypothetical protein